MKRFLSLILIAIILLSAFSLTSCRLLEVLGIVKPQQTEPEKETVTTITEEEWNEVYNSTNYTLYCNENGNETSIIAADTVADIYNLANLGIRFMFDITNGAILSQTSFGYVGGAISLDGGISGNLDIALGSMGYFPSIKYRDLVYNEDSKSYTVNSKNWSGELRFEDGILVEAVIESANAEDNKRYELTKVGATVLALPEYVNITDNVIEPSKAGKDVVTTITEEEIESLFEEENFTITANLIIADMLIKVTEDSTLTKISLMGEEIGETYTTCIDGEWYELQEDLDNIDSDVYLATKNGYEGSIVDSLGDFSDNWKLEDLTYNEEGRYYWYENEGKTFYLYFENGMLVQLTITGDLGLGFGEDMEIICPITNVGTTTIELPKYVVVD